LFCDDKTSSSVKYLKSESIAPDSQIHFPLYKSWLEHIKWQDVVRYNKEIQWHTAWYVREQCQCDYKYGKQNVKHAWFDDTLDSITEKACHLAGIDPSYFNSCNLNFYFDEKSQIPPHSDNEPLFRENEFKRDVFILSLSLGGSRDVVFRKQFSNETHTLRINDGDLYTMNKRLQDHYQHYVPPHKAEEHGTSMVTRYNLTWRRIQRHCKGCPLRVDN